MLASELECRCREADLLILTVTGLADQYNVYVRELKEQHCREIDKITLQLRDATEGFRQRDETQVEILNTQHAAALGELEARLVAEVIAIQDDRDKQIDLLRVRHASELEKKAAELSDSLESASKCRAEDAASISQKHEAELRESIIKVEQVSRELDGLRASSLHQLSLLQHDFENMAGLLRELEVQLLQAGVDWKRLQSGCDKMERRACEAECLLGESRDTINQLKTEALAVELTLEMDFEEVHDHETFGRHVVKEIAGATGVSPAAFKFLGLRAGSVIVDMEIVWHKSLGVRTPQQVFTDMAAQSNDVNSALRQV